MMVKYLVEAGIKRTEGIYKQQTNIIRNIKGSPFGRRKILWRQKSDLPKIIKPLEMVKYVDQHKAIFLLYKNLFYKVIGFLQQSKYVIQLLRCAEADMIAAAEVAGRGRWKWMCEALTGLVKSRWTAATVHAATPAKLLKTSWSKFSS